MTLLGVSFEVRLALRYFRTGRKSLARFTSAAAVVGIAAGVASLIIAQAVARGFADEMRDKILGNTPHISVALKDGGEIGDWEAVSSGLKTLENVAAVAPTASENALVLSETRTAYAVLRVMPEPGGPAGTIRIGAKLAAKLGAGDGDVIEIATAENQNPTKFRIGGTFETGIHDYDATFIHLSPESFVRLRGISVFVPSVLSISVKDVYRSDRTAEAVRAKVGDAFRATDWQEANRPLFAALGLERKASFAVISLIVLIAALNITTTLALLVNERRLDIAVLRTCGAKTRSLLAVFLLEGLLLGLAGTAAGIVLGVLGCALGNYSGVLSLSSEVYSISRIPLVPDPLNILAAALTALVVSLAASFYPALKASRIKPLENLRRQ